MLKQNFGTNASLVISRTKEKLNELKKDFPPGMDYEINYDVSKFVNASIDKVVHTLGEAFVLVALVVFSIFGRLAVNFDTHYSGTGVVDRCFCIYAIVWADDKPDNTVCISAGHWYCGR